MTAKTDKKKKQKQPKLLSPQEYSDKYGVGIYEGKLTIRLAVNRSFADVHRVFRIPSGKFHETVFAELFPADRPRASRKKDKYARLPGKISVKTLAGSADGKYDQ